MGNRYLIVSDLHLCDIEDHPDGWKAYKGSRYMFDAEFARLVGCFVDKKAPEDRLILVLNGDIFDFDLISAVPAAPSWPVSRSQKKHGLHPSAEKSAWKLGHILSFHPVFLETLAGFLCQGHQLVYVMGNHDREFHFPEVRKALLDELHRACRWGGFDQQAVQFEPWFFHVPGELYVEHGQQYDHYSSFRTLLCPVSETRQGPMLDLPTGNLSNRYLMTRMGFFNPFATDYILDIHTYINHWLKKYAFTRRSLLFTWLFGSIGVVLRLLEIKRRQLGTPRECRDLVSGMSVRLQLPLETLEALQRLQRKPITDRFFRMVREFWLDRLTLFLLMVGGTIALSLVDVPLWVKLMVPLSIFPLSIFIYETFARGESVFTIEREIPKMARAIVQILPVKVVAFGHDHVPRLLPIAKDVTFVDTGTWAPILDKSKGQELALGYRNYLMVSFGPDQTHQIEFGSWM